jgi:hypothetical protein
MKRMVITSLALTLMLGMTYNARAGFWGWSAASALSIYTNGDCSWIFGCGANPERHWLANFYNAVSCSTGTDPKYNGSSITDGNWYTAGDTNNQYQLTKGWLQGRCINIWPCTACSQTTYSCSLSNFTAYCYID